MPAIRQRREADEGGYVGGGRGEAEEDVGAGDQVDARGDHGRGVDQGGDRGGALHRVGQPGMERQLGRLGEGPEQEQQADRHHGPFVGGEDVRGLGEDGAVVEGADLAEDQEGRQGEADVADHVDHEGLHPGPGGGGAPVPEADQRVGGEADEGPADDQQHEVAGEHQQQHREDEEVEVAEEAVVAAVRLHVAERVEVDQAGDPGDHEDHEHRERVDQDPELDVEPRRVGVVPGRRGEAAGVRGIAQHGQQGTDRAGEGERDRGGADDPGDTGGEGPEAERGDDRSGQREGEHQPGPGGDAHPFSSPQLIDVERQAAAEDGDDQPQADDHLAGRHDHHDQGEDLPRLVAGHPAEGHQGEVARVQHQLQAEQDDHRAAADQHAAGADREQQRREDDVPLDAHRDPPPGGETPAPAAAPSPEERRRPASTTAPTAAISRRRDAASKGIR